MERQYYSLVPACSEIDMATAISQRLVKMRDLRSCQKDLVMLPWLQKPFARNELGTSRVWPMVSIFVVLPKCVFIYSTCPSRLANFLSCND